MIVGLDLAATSGMAVVDPLQKQFFVMEFTPLRTQAYEQKILDVYECVQDFLASLDKSTTIIGIEKFVYFGKSRITQGNLCKLIGFVEISLMADGWNTQLIIPSSARKKIGFVGKEQNNKKYIQKYLANFFNLPLTDNMTDALTVAFSFLDDDWRTYEYKLTLSGS